MSLTGAACGISRRKEFNKGSLLQNCWKFWTEQFCYQLSQIGIWRDLKARRGDLSCLQSWGPRISGKYLDCKMAYLPKPKLWHGQNSTDLASAYHVMASASHSCILFLDLQTEGWDMFSGFQALWHGAEHKRGAEPMKVSPWDSSDGISGEDFLWLVELQLEVHKTDYLAIFPNFWGKPNCGRTEWSTQRVISEWKTELEGGRKREWEWITCDIVSTLDLVTPFASAIHIPNYFNP